MAARYWDYWDETSTTGTTTTDRYYRAWSCTGGTSTATTLGSYYTTGGTWTTYAVQRVERYLVSGFDGWSDKARATLTRLINDETHTGFKIEMWIKGDVDVTDMGIQLRDLDWFMMRLRQVANPADYQKIAECVAEARKEAAAQGTEAGTAETEGLGPKDDGPVPEGNAP